jgi:hypothetical protein
MSPLNDYPDEMDREWLSEEETARFRRDLMEAPSAETEASHLAAMREAFRPPIAEARPGRNAPSTTRRVLVRTRAFVIKIAAATLVLGGSMVGLAYAGVDLPGSAAENALEAVLSVELPNQGGDVEVEQGDKSVADDVRAVIESTAPEDRDCEFGQAVSDAATANSQGEGTQPTDPCAHQTGTAAQGGKATGEEASAEGGSTADEGSGEHGAPEDAGRTTGGEASEDGRSHAPQDSPAPGS